MLVHPEHEHRLDRLTQQVRTASAPTAELSSSVIADCTRLSTLLLSGQAARIERLLKAGAWTDAAFSLIAFELPAWTLRRLINEDGEWMCSLSRQPHLPVTLDDAADAHHACLPLAILGAFLEARRRAAQVRVYTRSVPQVRTVFENPLCCDNFS